MLLHPFLPQKKLFKAYDIRGELTLFTDDFLWALANGFAQLFACYRGEVVIGYDVRHQSETIAKFIAFACQAQGIKVIWLGQVTTPIMAFTASQYSGHGLIVTASHSERHINGIKWLVDYESPSTADIMALYDSLADYPAILPNKTLIEAITNQVFATHTATFFHDYQQGMMAALAAVDRQQQRDNIVASAAKKFYLVIDCMNGATSAFAAALFEKLGHRCMMLNDTPDANFSKGNPDPTEAGRLSELARAVTHYQADLGLAFDGDGDRIMVVDAQGRMVSPDHLLYLLATIALTESPVREIPTEIIFDVKCSHHVPTLLANQGAVPVMEKTGSSLMRKSLQSKQRHSVFAGELSGHFLFNDGYFVLHDDAMYAGARLLHWLSYQSASLSDMIDALPISVNTADMYLPIDNAEMAKTLVSKLVQIAKMPLESLKQVLAVKHICTIDGLRVDFANGFGVLRRSNTGNFLTVRFSGNTLADLQAVQTFFVRLCERVDADLAKQVAQIQPV